MKFIIMFVSLLLILQWFLSVYDFYIGHTGAVTGLIFDATGHILASCSADMSAKLWDLSTYTCIKTLKGHDHTLSSVVFTQSGDQVITCGRDQTIRYWETSTGYCLKTLSGHNDWVKCLSVSLDGNYLISVWFS